MTRTERVRAALTVLPKGVLVSIIIVLLGALSTVGYAGGKLLWSERTEIRTELKSHGEDLQDLVRLTDNMVQLIEYNQQLAEENEADVKVLRNNIHQTQLRVERILARGEARLDNES